MSFGHLVATLIAPAHMILQRCCIFVAYCLKSAFSLVWCHAPCVQQYFVKIWRSRFPRFPLFGVFNAESLTLVIHLDFESQDFALHYLEGLHRLVMHCPLNCCVGILCFLRVCTFLICSCMHSSQNINFYRLYFVQQLYVLCSKSL